MPITSTIAAAAIALHVFGTQPSPKQASQDASYDEWDHVEPQTLDALVKESDVILIARIIGRERPRVQTNPLMIRGEVVSDQKTFARYVISPSQIIKAPKGVEFTEGSVVEEMVLDGGLARFKAGEPALGNSEVLLFLRYYQYAGTFILTTWRWQILRTPEGGIKPVVGPADRVAFLREHFVARGAETAARSDAWDMFVGEVEGLTRSPR